MKILAVVVALAACGRPPPPPCLALSVTSTSDAGPFTAARCSYAQTSPNNTSFTAIVERDAGIDPQLVVHMNAVPTTGDTLEVMAADDGLRTSATVTLTHGATLTGTGGSIVVDDTAYTVRFVGVTLTEGVTVDGEGTFTLRATTD